MFRTFPFPVLSLCVLFLLTGSASMEHKPQKKGPWGVLLKKHVDENGFVDYEGFKRDRSTLDVALDRLRNGKPSASASDKEKIAYWINVYNAFTIDLILRNRPLESINDIEEPFDRKFIEIGKEKYSLNDVEKGILLEEFDDPRIHYAVNCASVSCPPLRAEPYRGMKLEEQLKDQAVRFVNDKEKNRLSKDRVRISKLYDWYRDDFTRKGSLVEHLDRYSKDVDISKDAEVDFLEYDWGLNESP